MSVAMILSSAALGISLVITAVKLVDGFLRADPRLLISILTWLLCLIALASIPCLIVLLVYQQWAPAMMLGAGMLVVLTLLNWQSILARTHFPPIWTAAGDLEPLRDNYGQPAPDHELARRAAIVLEDYLVHAGGAPVGLERNARPAPLSHDEALDVLGLERGAAASAIRAAHRRLMQLVHPDRGGSNYLAARINEAKDILLAETDHRRVRRQAAADAAPTTVSRDERPMRGRTT
jgi:hypothetical protein